MANTWIVDLRHALDEHGQLVTGPAGRIAAYWTDIVEAATVRPPGPWAESATRCRRRPGRVRCPGRIHVRRAGGEEPVEWQCPACGDRGRISGWAHGAWDLRPAARPAGGDPPVEVTLSDEEYAELRACAPIRAEAQPLLAAATVRDGRVVVEAGAAAITRILAALAFEANRAATRRRQQALDELYERFRDAAATEQRESDEPPGRPC